MVRIVGGRKTARKSHKRSVRRMRHKRGRKGGGDIEEGNPEKEEYARKTPEELAEEGRSPSPVNLPTTEEKMEEGSLYSKLFGGKRKSRKHPRKGQMSKTRKGRKDFVTHKGDKMFNRKGHRQSRRANKSKKGKPYFMKIFGL